MLPAQLVVQFVFYSFLGWCWESVYCTICEKEWQDRGFLFGPICPIYGFSVVIVTMLCQFFPNVVSANVSILQIFLVCMFGSAVMEYTTSFVLEKRFHMRWWDYSDIPLNINGRICLPCSVGFGVAGVVIIKYVLPVILSFHSNIPPVVNECLAILFAGVLGMDFMLTEASLSHLIKKMQDYKEEFNIRAELAYSSIEKAPEKLADAMREAKEAVTERVVGAKDVVTDKMVGAKDVVTDKMVGAKDIVTGKVVGAKDSYGTSRDVLTEHENMAARYASLLSRDERKILKNIKKFPKWSGNRLGKAGAEDKLTTGERLKAALRLLEKKEKEKENEKRT